MPIARKTNRDLLSELRALGTLCHSQGDLTRAEQHFRLALNLYETSHQDDHVDAAICLFGLVDVLQQGGKTAEAEQFEQLLEKMNASRRAK
jgi:hypothetical protein